MWLPIFQPEGFLQQPLYYKLHRWKNKEWISTTIPRLEQTKSLSSSSHTTHLSRNVLDLSTYLNTSLEHHKLSSKNCRISEFLYCNKESINHWPKFMNNLCMRLTIEPLLWACSPPWWNKHWSVCRYLCST